jgi:hypothetical protein
MKNIIHNVFLKKTQTIILSFDEYTVYKMFGIMMLYDCYNYYCHFLSKYHSLKHKKINKSINHSDKSGSYQ